MFFFDDINLIYDVIKETFSERKIISEHLNSRTFEISKLKFLKKKNFTLLSH